MNTGCQGTLGAGSDAAVRPADAFDYNYCGSMPVYPVIGVNFATYCGPSNHLVLGRTGKLMWVFPAHGDGAPHEGQRQLTVMELKRLSLLAEAVQLSGVPTPHPGAVNYRLGVNFFGRDTKRMHAVLDDAPTPVNQLFRAMLDLASDKPALPVCDAAAPAFFDPLLFPGERRPVTMKDMEDFLESGRGLR
jgi:hypothetical protein